MKTPKCIGILGRLFGHKYRIWHIDYTDSIFDFCLRCGMTKGWFVNK